MSPGEIHQLVCIQNILFIQHSIRRPSIVLYCFIFRRVNSKTHQLVKIKGIEIDFKASGDPRSKLWHVLSRLLIATTPYHSQLSGTKGADHLESAWDEDVLWVKVAWIFSGIAYCLQTRLYSRRFESIIYDRNKEKPKLVYAYSYI